MLRPFSFVLFRSPSQSLQKAYQFFYEPSALFEQSVFLSSTELWNQWQKLEQLSSKEKNNLLLTLNRYWLRSCTRCTPFAGFAGCFIANISSEKTSLVLSNESSHRQNTRLDMNFITALCNSIAALPQLKNQLVYSVNNSLYALPFAYRYAEYFIENNTRKYVLTEIEKSEALEKIIALTKGGNKLIHLKNELLKDEEVGDEEAAAFIDALNEAQVLVHELEPAITGKDQLEKLINQLQQYGNTEALIKALHEIHNALQPGNKSMHQYQLIQQQVKALPIQADTAKNVLQTDLFFSTQQNNINDELINAIVLQAGELMFLSKEIKNNDLKDFKKRFINKYEDREILLNEVLDADAGIGYGNVQDELTGAGILINDLDITLKQNNSVNKDDISRFVFKKYIDCLSNQSNKIEITKEELQSFSAKTNNLHFANSMYLMGSLFKQNNLLDKDNFLFDLTGFGGPSAANLLGRFSYADAELLEHIQQIIKAEETANPNALYAEIVHLPEAKIGNILQRPVMRNYEIVYCGKSGAENKNQIFADDILVSIRNNKIILRSRQYNKEIIPRLTSAHNYTYKSLPVYKFLCDLQTQQTAKPCAWDWGELQSCQFLPQVMFKNIIIKKARWKIDETKTKKLPASFKEQKKFCYDLIQKLQLPKQVVLAEGDNELMLDFEEEKGIELFIHFLKKQKTFLLEEFLFNKSDSVIKDENGAPHTNEIIIPLSYNKEQQQTLFKFVTSDVAVKRTFEPFSEWQYYKLYCGPKSAEKILANHLKNFITEQSVNKLYDKFFFLRFKDEFSHLRLRFFNHDKNKQTALHQTFAKLLEQLINDQLLQNFSIETYTRELERYDAKFIENAESIFYNDSMAVFELLHLIQEHEAEDYRLYFALKGIDILLDDFGYDFISKQKLLQTLQQSFFKEFGASPQLQKQLNERYRQHQQTIFSIRSKINSENELMKAAVEIFTTRSIKNKLEIDAMILKTEDLLTMQQNARHYLHLFINRLFISSQRKYELVIYHFLEKYYASQIAINKKL